MGKSNSVVCQDALRCVSYASRRGEPLCFYSPVLIDWSDTGSSVPHFAQNAAFDSLAIPHSTQNRCGGKAGTYGAPSAACFLKLASTHEIASSSNLAWRTSPKICVASRGQNNNNEIADGIACSPKIPTLACASVWLAPGVISIFSAVFVPITDLKIPPFVMLTTQPPVSVRNDVVSYPIC
jgi:hypothetical protein